MYQQVTIEHFFSELRDAPLIDVRSPKEFNHAHIPGSVNIPLFNDEERARVGIIYKTDGRNAAIQKGLEIVGPKMIQILNEARSAGSNPVVMCWRGGMRSKSVATLLDFAGITTKVIIGGYKNYRREVQKMFTQKLDLIILGGKTGSAKTNILHALKEMGEQVIDLERLANHKGSAFGDIGENPQPSTEMFENLLFEELSRVNREKRIWIEDESNLIGSVFIPPVFWQRMREAPVIYCEFPLEERINYLVNTYGNYDAEDIIRSVHKITRKLGGQHAKTALQYFEEGNLKEATRIVLVYYDKTYTHGTSLRNQNLIHPLAMDKIAPLANAKMILGFADQLQLQKMNIAYDNSTQ